MISKTINLQHFYQFFLLSISMSHLKINTHFGNNLFNSHQSINYLQIDSYLISVGKFGDLLMLNKYEQPLFLMMPTINNESGSLRCYGSVYLSNLIEENFSKKLITLHEDNRLRIWSLQDGICINVSNNKLFEQNIIGICSQNRQNRFVYVHSEYFIYIIDIYRMSIVAKIKLTIKIIKLSKIDKNLIIKDNYKKTYLINIEQITKQKWMDIRSIISVNNQKLNQELKQTFSKFQIQYQLKQTKDLFDIKQFIIQRPQKSQFVNKIINQIKQKAIINLFNKQFAAKYEIFIQKLNQEKISQSCMFFVSNNNPYYFIGCKSGSIYGFRTIGDIRKNTFFVYQDQTNNRQIRFMNVKKNYLVVSSKNNLLSIFCLDNLDLGVQTEIRNKIDQNIEVIYLPLMKYLIFQAANLTSPVKNFLDIYKINSRYNDNISNDNFIGFQLQNKLVVIVNLKDKSSIILRGCSKNTKIYSILVFDLYYGVVTNTGIMIYNHSNFERMLTYDQWDWKQHNLIKKTMITQDYHNFKSSKKSNQNSFIVQFLNRYITKPIDYFNYQYELFYEAFGKIQQDQISNENYPQFYFYDKKLCDQANFSKNIQSYVTILKLHHNKQRRQSWQNTSYIMHTDAKIQVQALQSIDNLQNKSQILLAFQLLFPWQLDLTLSEGIDKIIGSNRSILKHRLAFQGIGTSFTIYYEPSLNFCHSSFLSSYQSIMIMLYFISFCNKDNNNVTDLMFKCVQCFTTKKPSNFMPLGLNNLAYLSIQTSNNIVNAGCNLMISNMLGKQLNLNRIEQNFILNLKYLQENKLKILSKLQIYWIIMMGLGYIYSVNPPKNERIQILLNRIINAIEIINFEKCPDLIAINLKIFNEGIAKWKNLIQPNKALSILNSLFILYFYYDGIASVTRDDKKFNFCFYTEDKSFIKKMKQIIIKTIVYIANQYINQFLQVLKKEALNQQVHILYPCSVIQILRQFLKSQKPTKHLVFYMQLLLKCLSPTTPNLRKYVQKNVTQTLYHMCSYKAISFNQSSQKIALLSSNHIYIYDLRTATKWRTIDIQSGQGIQYIVQMSPKGNYIAVLGKNLRIWRLSSSFWSGVLGAFSQGWTFQASGKQIKWENNQTSITIQSNLPSQTKTFNL